MTAHESGRTPRQRPDGTPKTAALAERAVLGMMLRDRLAIDDIVKTLKRADRFGEHAHQVLFDVITDLHADGRPIDMVAVANELEKLKRLDDVGYAYLADTYQDAPSSANADYYAGLVLNAHTLRGLAFAAERMHVRAESPTGPAAEMVGECERELAQLAEAGVANEPVTLMLALEQQFALMERRQRGEVAGVPTGYLDLDQIIVGLQPQEFVGIGARPSVGKTALGTCIARNLAAAGRPVLFASLEQSRQEIAERLLAAEGSVDSWLMRTGKLTAGDQSGLADAFNAMAKWKLFIDDSPNQTVTVIAANARRMRRRHGIEALFVDYLQLVEPENRRADRYEQVGAVSRRLKQLARELKIAVVAMIQVGREGDEGSPKLRHLRESGNIEQDLDVALLMHRTGAADEALGPRPEAEEIAVEVAKNRNGRTGRLVLLHRRKFTRFENFAQGPEY